MSKFRSIRSSAGSGLLFIVLALGFSCSKDLTDDPIPPAIFPDAQLNLSFPEFVKLQTDGGYLELTDIKVNSIRVSVGVRGIIIYRHSASVYAVFDKNCSFHPNEACATVNVHSSNLFMNDPCCNSNFSFSDGMPTGGPAWRALRKYKTYLQGSVLTITSESENGM